MTIHSYDSCFGFLISVTYIFYFCYHKALAFAHQTLIQHVFPSIPNHAEAAQVSGLGYGCGTMSDRIHMTCPWLSSSSSFRLRSPNLNSLRLRRIFDMFDKNEDAIITVNEISQSLSLLGLDAELIEIDSLVRSYIKPGNEGLTYEDFKALHESLGDTLFGFVDNEGDQRTAQEESDLSEAFRVFDENGDGYISAKELQVILRKLGLIEENEFDRVQKMIFSVDRNQDGHVDFFEFKDMMRTALVPSS